MLQIRPDPERGLEPFGDEDDALYCAACGELATRLRWRLVIDGAHEHLFVNPAGLGFEVLCFREAPGVFAIGEATDEATWFGGYDWQVALCAGCRRHIGWRYAGVGSPAVFFGLIKPRLTGTRKR